MSLPFIHLRVHSEYSLIDGLVRIDELVAATLKAKMPAVALTDKVNMFGVIKFYKAAESKGIKPILGADLWVENPDNPAQPFNLLLLCQDQQGYQHLTQLLSRAYIEGQSFGMAQIKQAWLVEANEGLIALSGALAGDIGQSLQAGDLTRAEAQLATWIRLFPNRFYLEIQRTGRAFEDEYITAVLPLAKKMAVPVVATNDVHFLSADDFMAHEARVCIYQGRTLADPKRPRSYSPQQYFRSSAEMQQRFIDIPQALTNTFEIAKRCTVSLALGQVFLPNFPIPEGYTTNAYFETLSHQGLEKRLTHLFASRPEALSAERRVYDDRLAIELQVINDMGFAGYFLIVADFIAWSKTNDIPVGPGRGSGAGSLVAYALGITDLDPLQYDLLFERFLNPERVSLPDFDIDFCMEGRDRVIDYVAEQYGRHAVSQIITYGTMAAKAVIRDVGRIQGHAYGFVDKLAKLIPLELGITLEKALSTEPLLLERYQQEEEVTALLDLAMKLEGITRNAGKHAGGVVIAPTALTDFCPLYCEPNSNHYVTQFDKDDVETVGLIKFDFLGLRTLTIIHSAVKLVNTLLQTCSMPPIDIHFIPLDDAQTYTLLKNCQTTAVFQLESRGMKDLIKRLQPDFFEEIIALVALFRPGPLQSGMVDDFIDRKHGRATVTYPHPDLEPILKPTYGVILYQEQVMQIAQVLAGYSLGSADLLRRAMGKKKPEEMAQQREIFVSGAMERGVNAELATDIFDLMEKFAGYGFNKSHSAAYALVAYQTAWLKAHYPSAFMAAVLSSDMDNTDKVIIFVNECQEMDLRLLPPNINTSAYFFTVDADGTILYGLGAIKGAGQAAIDIIIEERMRNGSYVDLFDFCRRVDLRKVNKRVLEAFIGSGAMDCFGYARATLMAGISQAVKFAELALKNSEAGQGDLFGGEQYVADLPQLDKNKPEWSEAKRLQLEKSTLGLYLSGHPIHAYEEELSAFGVTRIHQLQAANQPVWVAGFIVSQRFLTTKRGDKMAFITLDDQAGRIDVAVFSDSLQQARDVLASDNLIFIEGEVSHDDFKGGLRMTAKQLLGIEDIREQFAKEMVLVVLSAEMTSEKIALLDEVLAIYQGNGLPVFIEYILPESRCRIRLPKEIIPSEACLNALEMTLGKAAVKMRYFGQRAVQIGEK